MREIRKTVYFDANTKDQRLAIDTCPGFEVARQRALGDLYEIKTCEGCRRVQVKFTPHIDKLEIKGNCPKV